METDSTTPSEQLPTTLTEYVQRQWEEFFEAFERFKKEKEESARGVRSLRPLSPQALEDLAMALMRTLSIEEEPEEDSLTVFFKKDDTFEVWLKGKDPTQLGQVREWALAGALRTLRRTLGEEESPPLSGQERAILGAMGLELVYNEAWMEAFSLPQDLRMIFENFSRWGMDPQVLEKLKKDVQNKTGIDPCAVPPLTQRTEQELALESYQASLEAWRRGGNTALHTIEFVRGFEHEELLPPEGQRYPQELLARAGDEFMAEVQKYLTPIMEGEQVAYMTLLVHLIHLLPLGQDVLIRRALIHIRTQQLPSHTWETSENLMDEWLDLFANIALREKNPALARQMLDGVDRVIPGFGAVGSLSPDMRDELQKLATS